MNPHLYLCFALSLTTLFSCGSGDSELREALSWAPDSSIMVGFDNWNVINDNYGFTTEFVFVI